MRRAVEMRQMKQVERSRKKSARRLAEEKIRVHKVWVAIHGGTVVNPEMATRNIESGVIYGMSSILKERATVKNGAVEQSNFHDYEVLRMSEAPESIEVNFIPSNNKPTGLGEVGNPFIPDRVLEALKA
jgi:isoquinoline 1-oxidoreductase beta subunit